MQSHSLGVARHLNLDMSECRAQSAGSVTCRYSCQDGQDWNPNSEINLALGQIFGSNTSAHSMCSRPVSIPNLKTHLLKCCQRSHLLQDDSKAHGAAETECEQSTECVHRSAHPSA
jgi:hypothetical protein